MNLEPAGTGGSCDGDTGGPLTCIYNDSQAGTVVAASTCGGNAFSSWTGNCDSAVGTTCNFTMASNRTVTANYATAAASGTVAWWKLDEATGTSADDASVNTNTGTLTNGPTWTTARGVSAVHFDGVDDSINIAASATLSFGTTNASTIRAWVLPDSTMTGFHAVVVNDYTWFLYASSTGYCGDGNPLVGFSSAAGTIFWTACHSSPLSTTIPTRLAASYDGTNLILYRNGREVTRSASGAVIDDGTSGAVTIGRSTTPGEFFLGKIWDVIIDNQALSAAQILADIPVRLNSGGNIVFSGNFGAK
jgi:hypothetical protein